VRILINWDKCVGTWEKLARGIPLGEPTVLLATLAAIFLAFLPVSPSSNDLAMRGTEWDSAAAMARLSPWKNFPMAQQESSTPASPLFPFSVIPGGVRTADELKNAVANDRVVAEHYAGFNLEKTHTEISQSARMVYVSYRMGNSVFWTKHQLRIPEGELLITDGKHEARTRCGNQLSETPVTPVSPEEPPVEAMERAQDSDLLAINIPPPEMPLSPAPVTEIPPIGTHHIFIPPIVPIWWGAGTPPGGIPVTPPVITPEPETVLLLSTGLTSLWLLRKKKKV